MCHAVNQVIYEGMQQAREHTHEASQACCPLSVRYPNGTMICPFSTKRVKFRMHAYMHASFAANLDNRGSASNFLFLLRGGPISLGAKKRRH